MDASQSFESGMGRPIAPDAATVRDADTPSTDGSRDAALDVAPDVAPSPDCTCPPGDFTLDAVMGTTPIHLAAPYVLNIYCEETAVTLGHPSCGQVYRLSGCAAPHYGPPCLYMGVDLSSGFLLGSFVDANGQPWDLLSGIIAPDPPEGRVATGNFAATLRPRAGGDVVSISGNFRACMPVFPACRE